MTTLERWAKARNAVWWLCRLGAVHTLPSCARTRESPYEWHYLPGGKVSHARLGRRNVAVCGRSPSWFSPDGWYGTGCQLEYETAVGLPRCKDCVRITREVGPRAA